MRIELSISEMGIIVAIIGVIVLTVYFILFIIKDYRAQDIAIQGREYRKKYGLLSENYYLNNENCIKEKLWIKQKNWGIHPKKLKKSIKIIDYSSNCNCIIQKKGL